MDLDFNAINHKLGMELCQRKSDNMAKKAKIA